MDTCKRLTSLVMWISLVYVRGSDSSHFETENSNKVAKVGDPMLELKCHGLDMDLIEHPIIFSKVLRDGQEVEVSNNAFEKEPFVTSGRYKVTSDSKHEEYTLTITNVRAADNGTYKCSFAEDDGARKVVHNVLVLSPIVEVILDTDAEIIDGVYTFDYDRPEPYSFNCTSIGGSPEPRVKVTVNDHDITHTFERNTIEVPINEYEKPGLEEISYNVNLVNNHLSLKPEYNKAKLKCVSRVPDSVDFRVTKAVDINILYSPVFEDCQNQVKATVGSTDFKLVCTVHSNPAVLQEQIMWSWMGENGTTVELSNGMQTDNFETDVEVFDDKIVTTLHVLNVNTTDFRQYKLHAGNGQDTKHTYIDIVKEYPPEPIPESEGNGDNGTPSSGNTSTAASVTSSSSLSIVCATILLLLTSVAL